MKAKILIIAGVASLAIVISVAIYAVNENRNNDLLWANVEALTEFESTITCDSGICGQCFEEEKAWPFYKCNWTGRQADYCDCDKIGWI